MTQDESLSALTIDNFLIDDDCVGSKWTVDNEDQLAQLIGIVAMGQAAQAAYIISELQPASPAFSTEDLQNEVVNKFTVKVDPGSEGYPRYQRDGLIFEIISWIAAKQVAGDRCYLKDPHIPPVSG